MQVLTSDNWKDVTVCIYGEANKIRIEGLQKSWTRANITKSRHVADLRYRSMLDMREYEAEKIKENLIPEKTEKYILPTEIYKKKKKS